MCGAAAPVKGRLGVATQISDQGANARKRNLRQRQQTIATEHSRRILDGLTAQNAATAPAQGVGTAARDNTPPTAKAAHTTQEDGADGSEAQG